MKKNLIITLVISVCALLTYAQPASVKNVGKSIVTLKAYDADGLEREPFYGFMIDTNGTVVAPWKPFAGASSVVAIDEKGNEISVETVAGVNELYDVCRFKLNGLKLQPLTVASKPVTKGNKVWLVQAPKGKDKATESEIEKAETFMEKYNYYVIAYNDAPAASGLPVLDDAGNVVALYLTSSDGLNKTAIDIQFIKDLQNAGLAINSTLFQNSCVRPELSSDKKDALLTIILAGQQGDNAKYEKYVNDYIAMFPAEVDGYSSRALLKVNANDFAGADKDMQEAVAKSTNKAESHAEYSRIIYQKLVFNPDTLFTDWTLDKALDEIQQAYALDAQPVYKHREAQIVFSKGEYDKAYEMFMDLTKTSLNSPEVFLEAAQCKGQLGANDEEILALLDSAVVACPKPYTSASASYILARGQQYDKMGEYRKALADYNVYDTLVVNRGSAEFYYTRYRCEMNVRQYQQALNDIAHAAYLNQSEPLYFAEMASLQLRVNRPEDAILASNLCLQLEPESTDALIIKGIALAQTGQKEEAIACLTQAKELGDERAPGLIKKYGK